MVLRDRLLGDPAKLDGEGLARGVRFGSEAFACGCVRQAGEGDDDRAVEFLIALLGDERAAIRRNAAYSLAHLGRPRAAPALARAWRHDRTEEGRLALAVGRARCGESLTDVSAALEQFERRTLQTWQGPRSPQAASGVGPLMERFWRALGDDGVLARRGDVLVSRRQALASVGGGDARPLIPPLAALRHPDDFETIRARQASAGRREDHALYTGFGLLGDPRALPILKSALFATDVDPGRGFTQRRLAATAIGRLGLTEGVAVTLRGMENEASDYEGRPGAGMGIQYPVRATLMWALGEIACADVVPTLIGYLGDTHGSATGGFYLPAMDALVKVGAAAVPALRNAVRQRGDVAPGNARGVLMALEAE